MSCRSLSWPYARTAATLGAHIGALKGLRNTTAIPRFLASGSSATTAAAMPQQSPEPSTLVLDSSFLSPGQTPQRKLFLILLNYSLPRGISALWSSAEIRMCADGGANRLYDELPALFPDQDPVMLRARHIPDLIRGDLDSVRPDVRKFYTSHKVPIEDLSHDQDTTDLTKCIVHLEATHLRRCAALEQHVVLVAGALGGRLDHTLSHLNTLYCFPHINLVLWGEGNLVRLCRKGRTLLRTHSLEGPSCALVPLGPPVTATSTGLRWNLQGTTLQVKGLLSTSNVLEEREVVVDSDGDMIWCTEVKDALLQGPEVPATAAISATYSHGSNGNGTPVAAAR